MNKRQIVSVAFLLLFATSAIASGSRYDFEKGTREQWTGVNIMADGPWPVAEWAVSGGASLKANVQLSQGEKYYLKLTKDLDLSKAHYLSATIKTSEWADFGVGVSVVVYVKTGENWVWHASNPAGVNTGSKGTTLTFGLAEVENLALTKEIGIELIAGAGASGEGAIYVDNVAIDDRAVTQVEPLWTLSRHYANFDAAGYPAILRDGEVKKLSPETGEVISSYPIGDTSYHRFGDGTILYVSDALDLVSVDPVNGSQQWQYPVDNRYFRLLHVTKDTLAIQDGDWIKAISRRDGKELWQYESGDYYVIHLHDLGYILKRSGPSLKALDLSNGQIVWQYQSTGPARYTIDKHGDIWVRNGKNFSVLGLLDKHNGSLLWQHDAGAFIDDLYTESADKVYFVTGSSYDENVVSAIDKASGKFLWQSQTLSHFIPHYEESGAIFIQRGTSLYGIDVNTGDMAWHRENVSVYFDAVGTLYTSKWRSPEINELSKINKGSGVAEWTTIHKPIGINVMQRLDETHLLLTTDNGFSKVDVVSGATLWHYSHGSISASYLDRTESTLYFTFTQNLYGIDLKTGSPEWHLLLDDSVHRKHQSKDYIFFQYDSPRSGAPYGLVALKK